MANARTGRCSREQILCGLRILFREQLFLKTPFDADTPFYGACRAEKLFWSDVDFADVFFDLETFFGFEFDEADRDAFFLGPQTKPPYAEVDLPNFTFGELADFIAARAPGGGIESLVVLGKPCAAAGAFRAIEDLASTIDPDVARFSPSTAIRERLRGPKLDAFWRKLRWISCESIPDLNRTPLTISCESLLAFAILLGGTVLITGFMGVFASLAQPLSWTALGGTGLVAVASLGLRRHIHEIDDQLPDGMVTYRDLALRMENLARPCDANRDS